MKNVTIYTDGACSGNPGPGGWAAVLLYNNKEKHLVGTEANTTNNRMELTAAIRGLQALKESCQVNLYTDSKYLKDGIEIWIHSWIKNNWKNSSKSAVKNQDLWQELNSLMNRHKVQLFWVKGHSGDPLNELADKLATQAIQKDSK